MVLKVTWPQALAWRMRRHFLDPFEPHTPKEVARRLCGLQAQVASSADLAFRLRSAGSKPGETQKALADGRLIKTWAVRGTLHYLAPDHAGDFLSLLAAGKSWERPSWVKYFGLDAARMARLSEVVAEALDGRSLTREELIAEVEKHDDLGHLADGLRSGWGGLLKPLAWQGILCFGPSQGNRVTFMRPEAASPHWRPVPPEEEAAPRALAAYLSAYGPASVQSFYRWLASGRVTKKQAQKWFSGLESEVEEVDVDGERLYILKQHADDLARSQPSGTVRLLGGFDQWVLGPGTEDTHVIPPGRRWSVSKQSGWIAPVVIRGGVACGTWEQVKGEVQVSWFAECGPAPKREIEKEVDRLRHTIGSDLRLAFSTAPPSVSPLSRAVGRGGRGVRAAGEAAGGEG